jgi:DNA replication protein DnaD
MDKGWIKLSRQIQDHWIWRDPEKLKAWLDILLLSNHETRKVEMRDGLVSIKRGQFVTSIDKLAERWKWSRNRVYRFLSLLEADGMVQRKANRYRTTLTVVNYGKFQDRQNTNGTSNGTSNETTDGTPNGTRTRKIKNEKEYKEDSSTPLTGSAVQKEEKAQPGDPGYCNWDELEDETPEWVKEKYGIGKRD